MKKKVKSQTNLCETLTHLLPFKEKKIAKNIRYMGTISLIQSPTWGLMVKKLYFITYKLTKMMQMSDYVIKTNKPKLLYLSFFQFCMLLRKSSHHCSFQVTRHVQTCLPEIIRKGQNNNLPRQSKSLLEKKINTKQFADLIVCC